MFFNNKNKTAKIISNAILNSIRVNFVCSDNLSGDGFRAPYGFWLDPYILGFINGLYDAFIKFDFCGDNMGLAKRTEIRWICLKLICEKDHLAATRLLMELSKSEDVELTRGMNDAISMFQVMSGHISENDKNPILVKAREIAPSFHEGLQEASDESSSTAALFSAVQSLTLGKHISERYLPSYKMK